MRYLTIFIAFLTVLTFAIVFFVVPPAEGLGNYVCIIFVHIPSAWIGALAFVVAAVYAWRVLKLRDGDRAALLFADARSARSAQLGLAFTVLATVTGAIFSRLTWGAFWNWVGRRRSSVCS